VIVSRLILKNWRNFRDVDVNLRERTFIVGPNASGKSNLLDVFRFLRDIAKTEGGGLQKAIRDRGGISKVRCLAARKQPDIVVELRLAESSNDPVSWRYSLGIKQQTRGERLPYISHEKVWRQDQEIITRPNDDDRKDEARLTQTYLEQISANADFREISRFLRSVTYLHLVPQLVRYADAFQGKRLEDDPFGQGFLEAVAKAPDRTRTNRLKKVEEALKIAVPQMQQLKFLRDTINGRPHLEALYSHWRPHAGLQREDQFSDGTLRLIALLWCLLGNNSLLLLEEPESSLNAAIVNKLAPLISRTQKQRKQQVILSTHSDDLLSDKGIDPTEVLLLIPDAEGTQVRPAAKFKDVKLLLEGGMSVGEAILPLNTPKNIEQLRLFE